MTLATGVAAGVSTPSEAASSPTIHSVETRIAAINTQAEKITEAYDAARGQLQALKGKAKATHTTLAKDQHLLGGMRQQVGQLAAAGYESGSLTPAASLLGTGNAETAIDRTSDLGAVTVARQGVLARAAATSRTVAADQATYRGELATERATIASISSKRSQIQALLAQETQQLDSLKARQQRRIAERAARAHAREVAQRQAYAAQHAAPVQAAAPTPVAATTHSAPSYSGQASGAAAVAVRFAYAQLGKPYVYGAAGPDSYDCSGLTMSAWGAAGVGLPHNAAEQQATVPSVSLSALEPGDLVFFGDPAYHVAIYIGGGRIIQAPHTGADVEISSLAFQPPTSAGRP